MSSPAISLSSNVHSTAIESGKYGRGGWRGPIAPVVVITLVTAFFFAPRLFGMTFSEVGAHMFAQYPWVGITPGSARAPNRGYPQTDHGETFYPLSVFATNALREGELPTWLPYSFGGIPIMEMGVTGLSYPPRLLAMKLFDPVRQHDVLLLLHLLLAGLGMYALLRCWGANALGATFGGFVWEFSGHNAFWLVLEHVAIAAAWCPVMLLCATLAVRRRSFAWAVATGLAVGLAILSGSTHYVYLGGVVLAVWYGSQAARAALESLRKKERWQAVRALLLPVSSVVVAIAVGAAFWLPLIETLPEFVRQPLTLQGQLDQAFSLAALGKAWMLPKSALSVAGAPDFASFAFTGLPALLLAAIALCLNRSAPVWLASGVGVISLATALGPRPLLAFLRFALPFFSTMNLHVAFYLFCFAVAVLAGFGASELSRRSARSAGRWHRVGLGVLIMAGAVQMGLFVWAINAVLKGRPVSFLTRQMQSHWQVRAGLYLCGVVIAVCVTLLIVKAGKRLALIRRGRLGRLPVGYGLVVAAAGQLILFAWLVTPVQPARGEWFYPKTPLITALQNLQRDRRVLPVYHVLGQDAGGPPVFAGKTAAIFGLRSGSGYESLLPGFTALLWRTVEFGGTPARAADMPLAYRPYFPHNRLPIGLLEKLSVGLLVTPPGVEPLDVSGRNLLTDEKVRLVYEGADGWIYEDSRALPRAFLAPQTTRVPDPESALRLLISPEFDARKAVIVSGNLPSAYAAALSDANQVPVFEARAEITRDRLDEVEVRAVSSRPAWLVLNDSWAAGWKAFVDGAEQPVARVNYAFRGLVVPAGSHQVMFRYQPRFLLLGFRASGGTLLLIAGFWLWLGLRHIVARRRLAGLGKKKGAAVL